MTSAASDTLAVRSVFDRARGRGVTFVSSRDETGTLSIRWTPPRALDVDERRVILKAGAAVLAALLDTG